MAKLHQLIAKARTANTAAENAVTRIFRTFDKKDAFTGMVRTYRPLDDSDLAKLPDESVKVQAEAHDLLAQLVEVRQAQWDLVATMDAANQNAVADVIVEGVTVASNVPVSTLLYLEKQLPVLAEVVGKLPVTDVAVDWEWDGDNSVWRADPLTTLRSVKEEKYVIVAPATDKHPAQVAKSVEDAPKGYWTTVKLSGACSPAEKKAYLERIQKLVEAVKVARESANSIDAPAVQISEGLLDFVFSS